MKNQNQNQNQNVVRVFHLTNLNADERRRLNRGGWDSDPKFTRHADITFGMSKVLADQVKIAWLEGEYHEAAVVKTDSLDWAYQQTNNISHVWNLNDDVVALTDQFKSTSVGDVMLKDGKFYVVASMGFEEIELEGDDA